MYPETNSILPASFVINAKFNWFKTKTYYKDHGKQNINLNVGPNQSLLFGS